jgi:4'-phosphopantetheinyl transferase
MDASSCPEITDWRPVTGAPELAPRGLHLWKVLFRSDPASEPSLAALSVAERERARTITNARGRANFVESRTAIRLILARYVGLAPDRIRFAYGPRGKPRLRSEPRDLQFNLSHSGPLCLLALSRSSALGVDTEKIRDMRHMDAIAQRMLGAEFTGYLRSLPEDRRPGAFFLAWTRLEAGVKAVGGGLFDGVSHSPERLSRESFIPHAGYRASIAVQGDCPPVRQWNTFLLDSTDPCESWLGESP